jgi:peptidoglycan/LPS O-acetylase OafA/YrhL
MIQRIQTLFLIGAAIISVSLFFLPLSEVKVTHPDGTNDLLTITLMEIKSESGSKEVPANISYSMLIINLLVLAGTMVTIFMYKNRQAQIRLTSITTLLLIVLIILIFRSSDSVAGVGEPPLYLTGVYLIAVQAFLYILARRAIRNDELLVRSADRIR